MSPKVAESFEIPVSSTSSKANLLHRFLDLYCTNFGPLWPLLTLLTLDPDTLNPLLFLVLTSIGAMYAGDSASAYATMMHNKIRASLIVAFDLGDGEPDFVWLAQARLLTQVAALYFGQAKAFTYAQHLGALLVVQARRMDLFSAVPASNLMTKFHELKGKASDQERLSVWLELEARRRLAFGIFRADTYTSVLLHTKPLVLLEEIDLELPLCDAVWRGERLDPALCLQMIEHDKTPGRQMRASDIYRIAMDQNELLLPLDPIGHELLMFGLQYPIWRFSRDQKMFERLTRDETRNFGCKDTAKTAGLVSGSRCLESSNPQMRQSAARWPGGAWSLEAHHLDSAAREMTDLELERVKLVSALQKWEQALPTVKLFSRTGIDRSSLLSSLMLYHLGYLMLYAPLEDLHQIQYRLADDRPIDNDLVVSIHHWVNSRRGRLAAERACYICSMIARESHVREDERVKFNLLAFTGLHHGAVLLWSYAGAYDFSRDRNPPDQPLSLDLANSQSVLVNKSESTTILQSFVELYDLVSHGRWSSFANAADRLSTQPFPAMRE